MLIYSLWLYHWFNVLWHILLLIVKIHIGNNKILIGNKRFKVFKSTWFAVSLDKRTLHTWAEIETKPLISIYIYHFFPPFFKNYFALDILEFFFIRWHLLLSEICVCPRMNMAFVETYIAHCNKQRSLPKKYMLMTLKQNIFQKKKKLWVKGYKNFIESFRQIKFFTIFRWLLSQIEPIFWHPAPNVHALNT